ncbi:hypothetical protein PABG_06899 [Paracoccidioides brasiliensis Pb03]|nr:hypothetical protein PABG_06899 [Paracoccidioides brasiliensis Pb03]
MGNTPSKPPSGGADSTNTTATTNTSNYSTAGSLSSAPSGKRVNRRSSIHALSGTTGTGSKSTAADPSASHESATGHPVPHRQQPPVPQWLQQSRILSESSRCDTYHSQQQSEQQQQQQRNARRFYRDNNDRQNRGYTRSDSGQHTHPARPRETSPELGKAKTKAVRVPANNNYNYNRRAYHHNQQRNDQYPIIEPSGPMQHGYYGASAHLSRPPRLPLPIGDATTAPGSPIIAPSSLAGAVPVLVDKGKTGEKDSVGSGLGLGLGDEEEEMVDELEGEVGVMDVGEEGVMGMGMGMVVGGAGVNKAVPTTIEWRGGGEKVYVTGTFVNWERKFRLQKSETEPNLQTATLQLRPGTHHLKFIVDGIMNTSDLLPTAVDFTNHLVNYIEVTPELEELPRPRRESDREKSPKYTIPPGLYPPQVLPDTLEIHPDQDSESDERDQRQRRRQQRQAPEEEIPLGDFRALIPPFLTDIDGGGADGSGSARYQQAANVVRDAPTPPMLPLLLGRSILNSATPMKDDSSVLNVPNHTVLNHLATSSIKNGVLATSVTTRYKTKCVTTIVYKPTADVTG